MRQILLKTETGQEITYINLPDSASEVPLNRYVDFTVTYRKIFDEDANAILTMAKAVGEMVGVDLESLLEAAYGPAYKTDDEMFGSLSEIFGYLANLVLSFEGELRNEQNYTFTYKGETWHLPFIRVVALVTGELLPGISASQAVEALEVIRLTDQHLEKPEGDPEGSYRYGLYLRLLAILASKEGEKMPVDAGAMQAFIAERTAYFQDIDTKTALDVDFFLTAILTHLGKTHRIAGSLALPVIGHGAVTQRLKWRRIKGRKNKMRKRLSA